MMMGVALGVGALWMIDGRVLNGSGAGRFAWRIHLLRGKMPPWMALYTDALPSKMTRHDSQSTSICPYMGLIQFFFFCLGEHCVYAMLSLAYSFATISIEKQAVLPVGTHQLACHLKGPIVCEKDIYCTCTCNHIKWHVYWSRCTFNELQTHMALQINVHFHVAQFECYSNMYVYQLAVYLHRHTLCKYVIVGAKWKHQVGQAIENRRHRQYHTITSIAKITAKDRAAPRVFRIQYSFWLHINVLESNEIKIHFISAILSILPCCLPFALFIGVAETIESKIIQI